VKHHVSQKRGGAICNKPLKKFRDEREDKSKKKKRLKGFKSFRTKNVQDVHCPDGSTSQDKDKKPSTSDENEVILGKQGG